MSRPTEQVPSPSAPGRVILRGGILLGALLGSLAAAANFIPLPEDALPSAPQPTNPLLALTDQAIAGTGSAALAGKIPDSFVIRNDNGQVLYDSDKRTISYIGGKTPIFMRTSEGQEIYARSIIAHLEDKEAHLIGPLVIYQGETLTHADGGTYHWGDGKAEVENVRAKVNGTLVRGSRIEYIKDAKGKTCMIIHDAYVSTEDVQTPGMWVGTGKLTVYPGEYGIISRLSIASGTQDVRVPILGWIPLSHSLNPREGYMPIPGVKSIWGAYLQNRYGILLGNRRVEHGMPVADYVATLMADYRTRRGLAGGVEFTDEHMRRTYSDMKGLSLYYAADKDPDINPTDIPRPPTQKDRYRISMQTLWEIPALSTPDKDIKWSTAVNANILSDRYMLRDFFEEVARVDDKPDNTVRLERRTPRSQTMFFTRFAPNNFYSTDERAELSYYRVRSTLGNTRIAYETNNSFGLMRQNIPVEQRELFRYEISRVQDAEVRRYYTRLLNTNNYFRLNTTHEVSTSFNILRFLNVTPKAGGGYTGYYDVEYEGADNRFLGYLSCDFDIKFSRHFEGVNLPSLGIHGLYHVIHPYATVSHGTISASNTRVPQIDTWSSTVGSSTINPMPLDLMGFTGIDGWGKWTVWRLGTRNTISTIYDGESRTLLNWNLFIDYNADNPNTESRFSNLYSIITLSPSKQFSIELETQTPTIAGGDDFNQYNTSITLIPAPWLETRLGHRYINNHPVQDDASQVYAQANLRLNEKYTAAARLYWDVEEKRIPIQQYSLFRKFGAWYVGSTIFLRDNGGRKETGFGLSFTLGETGTSLPVNFF